jgi:hypothetical protein
MKQIRPKQKPIDRLMAAMDACAIARGEAQWTLGYRTRFEALAHDKLEADRLCAKNLRQWQDVERVERKFRRLALRLLRELSSRADP